MSDSLYRDLADALQGMVKSAQPPEPAQGDLGGLDDDDNYAIEIPGQVNMVYARQISGDAGSQVEAFNLGVPIQPDYPVLIYTAAPRLFYVVPDIQRLPDFLGSSIPANSVAPHSHEPGLGLFDFVSPIRLKYGLVIVVTGTTVYVMPKFYFGTNGAYTFGAGGTLELTDYDTVASGEHQWLLAGYDHATNTPDVRVGDPVSLTLTLTNEMLTEIDVTDFEPLTGIRFAYGQTSLAFADFEYAQPWGGGGSGVFDPDSILTDADGNIVVDADGNVEIES